MIVANRNSGAVRAGAGDADGRVGRGDGGELHEGVLWGRGEGRGGVAWGGVPGLSVCPFP